MSLNRAALRLSTILALSNNATAPHPTLAAHRVYDSRLDGAETYKNQERVPMIVVYTDDDEGTPEEHSLGLGPFAREVTLLIEFMIPQMVQDGENLDFEGLVTDAGLEAQLDAMEHQIRFALSAPENPWAVLWRGAHRGVLRWSSQRFWADKEAKIRFAARRLMIRINLHDECPPDLKISDDIPGIVFRLPQSLQKLLDAVNADLDENGNTRGHVAPLVAMLNEIGIPFGFTAPPLKSVAMTTQPGAGAPAINTVADIPQD